MRAQIANLIVPGCTLRSPLVSDMRSLRSENKDATKLRSPELWADIEVRSAVRCAATRRIVRAGPIDRTWPMTTPGGDEADRAAMSASVHRTGEWWRRASGNSGALSKPQAGYGARLGSRSATRPSTATSGATESAVVACICICAVRPSNAENGTDPMIPEVGWPANGRYLSAQLAHRTEAESATSKPIP